MMDIWENPLNSVRIGIVGKYVDLSDTYKSLNEALRHGGVPHSTAVELEYIDSETLDSDLTERFAGLDGILVPGGFGGRGIEGKILAVKHAREKNIFGICLECSRCDRVRQESDCRMPTWEFDPDSNNLVDLMNEQREVINKGGTMRLGAFPAVQKGSCIEGLWAGEHRRASSSPL